MPIVNGWLLKKNSGHNNLKQYDFIVAFLTENMPSIYHKISDLHLITDTKFSRKCAFCKKHNRKSNTIFICMKCNVYLHAKGCFFEYHKDPHQKTNKKIRL
jgi:ribosomal protein L37AE/L43A